MIIIAISTLVVWTALSILLGMFVGKAIKWGKQ